MMDTLRKDWTMSTTDAPPPKPKEAQAPTALEMLIRLQNQNVEIIKQLRSMNSKLTFFVVVLILVIILQFVVSLLSLG
jgi:hypothetical protein